MRDRLGPRIGQFVTRPHWRAPWDGAQRVSPHADLRFLLAEFTDRVPAQAAGFPTQILHFNSLQIEDFSPLYSSLASLSPLHLSFWTTVTPSRSLEGCLSLIQLHTGEVRIHPRQLIPGPYVSIWGFGTLIKGFHQSGNLFSPCE